MSKTYKNPVCRSINGCGHCERCYDRYVAENAAGKSDTTEGTSITWSTIPGTEIKADKLVVTHATISSVEAPKITAASHLAGAVKVEGVVGLPVAGYDKTVEQWKVDMVNENKRLEELVLRRVDEHVRSRGDDSIDGASVQIARRHVEDAFYRLNRAIMQPKRIEGDL